MRQDDQRTWRREEWHFGTPYGDRDDRGFERDDRTERLMERSGHDRELDRFAQNVRGWDEHGASQLGDDRRGYGGYAQQGHGGRGQGYGGSSEQGRWSGPGQGIGGHRGKGPLNFRRSDDRICEIVYEALSDDDRIDASKIHIKVSNGEVTLTGSVDDRRTKWLVEDLVEDLPGVQAVQNEIRVQRRDETMGRDAGIDQLNSFLRGEISAVETYRMALEKLDRGSPARGELEACMRSHQERVALLREQITRLGGTPATSSGPWGVLAKIIEGGARVLGDKVAIAALEEGEDHGLKDYRDDVDKLDPELRTLVRSRLLPQQENTHSRMSSLKRRMSS
ncbi:MAG TPA: BON domain-containing protein [Kofleriaceae bacterium]|nr:BON domain-containing protein [Kofleriaceae bacterium]